MQLDRNHEGFRATVGLIRQLGSDPPPWCVLLPLVAATGGELPKVLVAGVEGNELEGTRWSIFAKIEGALVVLNASSPKWPWDLEHDPNSYELEAGEVAEARVWPDRAIAGVSITGVTGVDRFSGWDFTPLATVTFSDGTVAAIPGCVAASRHVRSLAETMVYEIRSLLLK